MIKKSEIIITTGGTGGHIFPAKSLAQELILQGFTVNILADKNYNKYHHEKDNIEFAIINSSQINKGVFTLPKCCFKIALGVVRSCFLIISKRPKIIVSFGGYATFPTLIAAILLRKKIILHEQNAYLGKVNRIFARFAKVIALSFKNTGGIAKKYNNKLQLTGNPVRKSIINISKLEYHYPDFSYKPKESKNNLGYNLLLASDFNKTQKIKSNHFNILVIGGSGGAQIFSKILPKAFFNIRTDLKNKINIIQQCRKDLLQETFNQYKNFNLNITIKSFFHDIEEKIAQSHLVIARSGSSTIFELAAAKKPTILIPFAKSADNHQQRNADEISKSGGAIVIKEQDFTINKMTDLIEKLVDNPELLIKMSKHMASNFDNKSTTNLVKIIKEFL